MNYQRRKVKTVNNTCRVRITKLSKQGGNVMQWSNGAAVYVQFIDGCNTAYFVNLKTGRAQYISIEGLPSNIGKGETLHFVCPETGRRVLDLYLIDIHGIFKSRHATKERLYYPQQTVSPRWRTGARLEVLQAKVKTLTNKRAAVTYNGRITHRFAAIQQLAQQAAELNYQHCIKLLTAA